MKEIIIKFTEENLLATTGKTSDELADLNGYQSVIVNPNYVPAVGDEMIVDPSWVEPADFNIVTDTIPMISNPDYVPAVGEPTMSNPDTRTQHLAKVLAKYAVEKGAEKIKDSVIRDAIDAAETSFKQSVDALISSAEITVVE